MAYEENYRKMMDRLRELHLEAHPNVPFPTIPIPPLRSHLDDLDRMGVLRITNPKPGLFVFRGMQGCSPEEARLEREESIAWAAEHTPSGKLRWMPQRTKWLIRFSAPRDAVLFETRWC